MKSLKILMMIAGFSTVVVASEGSSDKVASGYVQEGMNLLGSFGSYVTTKGSELSGMVSTKSSEYAQQATELASSGYKTAAEMTAKASASVHDYAQVGVDYAKTGVEKFSTEATKGYENSVKFINDNPKTVGAVTIAATVVAAVAVYRKLTLGYVFYKSKTVDKN